MNGTWCFCCCCCLQTLNNSRRERRRVFLCLNRQAASRQEWKLWQDKRSPVPSPVSATANVLVANTRAPKPLIIQLVQCDCLSVFCVCVCVVFLCVFTLPTLGAMLHTHTHYEATIMLRRSTKRYNNCSSNKKLVLANTPTLTRNGRWAIRNYLPNVCARSGANGLFK